MTEEVSCIDVARDFHLAELFFSTTNRQGVIRSGNEVFVRISGYEQSELIGFAHSKIRHPDMPQAVFQLFWNKLLRGETIAAYVKNRAKGGQYYWVMAVAAPCPGGFLSVRLKPSCGLQPAVEAIYEQIRTREQAARDAGMSKEEAIQQGTNVLLSELSASGFASYEAFMWHALSNEMIARQQTLHANGHHGNGASSGRLHASTATPIEQLLGRTVAFDAELRGMLTQLKTLTDSVKAFPRITTEMEEQSRLIGMAALNSRIAATSQTLKAVAQAMAESEQSNREILVGLRDAVGPLTCSLDELSFNVCVAALQGEICLQFLRESMNGNQIVAETIATDLQMLVLASQSRVELLIKQLDAASSWFRQIESRGDALERTERQLQFIRLVGVTESASLSADHTFRDLFGTLQELLLGMRDSSTALGDQVQTSKGVIQAIAKERCRLETALEQVLFAHHEFERQSHANLNRNTDLSFAA